MNQSPQPNTEPVACSLTHSQAVDRLAEWRQIQQAATHIASSGNQVTVTLPKTLAAAVEDLARRELSCCSFLSITNEVQGDQCTLTISGSEDALPVVAALTGLSTDELT